MSSRTVQEVEADIAVHDMINQLIAVMYEPVQITTPKLTKDVQIQVGFSCMKCDIGYSSNSGLRRHIKTIHEQYSYKCRTCSASYARLSTLMRHMEKVHVKVEKK